MNKKIVILIAIVAVAVVAIAAALALSGGSGNDDDAVIAGESRLMIYGNADHDDDFDENDIAMLKSIIAGDSPETKYADANRDGKIDQKDIDIVDKILKGQSTPIFFDDMSLGPVQVQYPIDSILGIHQDVLIPLAAINSIQYMHGYVIATDAESVPMLEELTSTQENVNTSYNQVDIEKLANLDEKPEYIFTTSTRLGNEAKLTRTGIQVLHLPFNGINDIPSSILTAGYMMRLGPEATKYVKFVDDLLEDIDNMITKNMSDDQRINTMCGYMTNCIDARDGSYTTATVAAGGKAVTDWDGMFREFAKGDEWIYQYPVEYFFYFSGWGFTEDIDYKTEFLKCGDYYTGLTAYKENKFFVLNSHMPIPLIVAYNAVAMYPDIVGEDYGDKTNQAYMEAFFPDFAKKFNASDYIFMISPSMVF